ncbi:MAG: 50S ribosomal protein L23 [Patescibacteria group bacterium]|nr:50S ribosomal protein L23 [Patescibacteria group bacterium]
MLKTSVIIKPIISERSMSNASLGWYTFQTGKKVTKKEIGKEIERLFKVNVVSVRTQNVKGKTVRTGRARKSAKKSDWKKAYVRLKDGQKIDLFEIAPKEKA